MAGKITAPYGSWTSPITSRMIVSETVTLTQVLLDGGDTYWIEGRPEEAGRCVIVHRTSDGRIADLTPSPYNARTRVHEYGEGAYTVDRGTVYFSNFADNRVYRQDPGAPPEPITPDGPLRYADFAVDRRHRRLICVREEHGEGGVINTLAAVPADGTSEQAVLASGNDFYSSPTLSADGARLAWLTWNHPNMPWDGTKLWVADIAADGSLQGSKRVAGRADESIFQPQWSPDGRLYFVSDRTGWWNIYRLSDEGAEPVTALEAELGVPQWVFGLSTYAFTGPHTAVCEVSKGGVHGLMLLDTETGRLRRIKTPYSQISEVGAEPDRAVFIAGSPTTATAVVQLDLPSETVQVLRRAHKLTVNEEYLSRPEAIEFPTEGGLTAHGFYYPPRNRDFTGPQGVLPPVIIRVHGGPTSSASTALNLQTQYWTSRGFALFDLNYGGSSGYGRAYRQRLNGQWGIVDVDDAVNAARHLVREGLADQNRLIIKGGSAGGYTTLAALAFRDVFSAGVSLFGVADLEQLELNTHKFESHYLDTLVGPYPEQRRVYHERSPVHAASRISVPVILFQGLDDRVVPPEQAEIMVRAMREKGLPFAYVAFPGEGHGFRKAENIRRALDGELFFYAKVFGFDLPDEVTPVDVENLAPAATTR